MEFCDIKKEDGRLVNGDSQGCGVIVSLTHFIMMLIVCNIALKKTLLERQIKGLSNKIRSYT